MTSAQGKNIKSVGILGGGQLARMLCLEGHKMGLEMHVLSSQATDPAALVTQFWHEGDINSPSAVKNFTKQLDVVTFESEFIADKIYADREIFNAQNMFPRIETLAELSDRHKQKSWLERHHIPTSRFSGLLTKSDAYSFLNSKKNNTAVVFKKRRFGYDGYGTFVLKDKKQIESWLNKNSKNINEYIVEDFIKFKRELAIQIAINSKSEVTVLPLVEWQAENSKCLWVKGPSQAKGLTNILKKIIKALKESSYVGLVAFEFFETSQGLIVNEVAPRVHNSGHYSLEALALNQFAAHLMAITNQTLPTRPYFYNKAFAMLNLIGESDKTPVITKPDSASLHWYAKTENRKGRKMGHLTTLSHSPEKALRELIKIRKGYTL